MTVKIPTVDDLYLNAQAQATQLLLERDELRSKLIALEERKQSDERYYKEQIEIHKLGEALAQENMMFWANEWEAEYDKRKRLKAKLKRRKK